MDTVTILWSAGAGVALTLAGVCGIVWLIERRGPATLMLCALGVATAVAAHAELGMMHAATPAEFGKWQQWQHLPLFCAFVAMMLFVRDLGTGRTWLMWAFLLARSVVLVLNFSVQPNFHFSNIASLLQVPLFGEQVSTIGVATTRGWQWFAIVSMILLLAYVTDAAVQAWRKGDANSRRKAFVIIVAVVLPLFGNVAYGQLLLYGVLQGVISNAPWLLGALTVMTFELGRDFTLSSRARLELAELRSELARVERAGVLGQLASSLAHELTQPLNAISLNAAVARKHLKADKPDVEELRTILHDIDSDDRRAAEIIDRMRRVFFQRDAVETLPLDVEDVLQDVVALVRVEALSKHVVIALLVQPGLPRAIGDRVHLSQVLLNLLANSIHALESGPVDARRIVVEARTEEAESDVEIVVRDSGPGIPADIVDNIFKPFFSARPGSLGVGLALSRTIIEAQGGHLWVDSEAPQAGAVFHLTLRRA